MRKILSLRLFSVLVLLCFGFGSMWADTKEITGSTLTGFGTGSTYKSGSTTIDEIIKIESSSALTATANFRVAKSATLTISMLTDSKITSIEFEADGSGYKLNDTNNNITWGTQSKPIGTYTNTEGTTSVTFNNSNANIARLNKINITYTTGTGETKTLTSISVSGTSPELYTGDAFSHEGITVTANYDDNSTQDVTSAATFSGYDMSLSGDQTVTVTYKEKTATYDINVKTIANTLDKAYTTAEAKAIIDAGKGLNQEVYVKGYISSIVSKSVNSGKLNYFIASEKDGEDEFEFYNGKNIDNTNFTSVSDIAIGDYVVGIGKLTIYNSTYEFAAGNYLVKHIKSPSFSIANIIVGKGKAITPEITTNNTDEYVVTYTSSDENVVEVSADGKTLTAKGVGTATITATIGATDNFFETSTTFTVDVVAELVGIEISGSLTKTTYYYGDEFDYSGLVVTALYDDESEKDVTEFVTWTSIFESPLTTLGENKDQDIEAEFEGETAATTVTFTVLNKLTGITIDTENVKKNFNLGEEFSAEGLVINAQYLNGEEEFDSDFAEFSGYDMTKVGNQTVTVEFTDLETTMTATYEITVNDPAFALVGDVVTDVLTANDFAASSTTYTSFNDVEELSGAVYAGKSAKNDQGAIQLRSSGSDCGIVSTKSGGIVKSVKVTFNGTPKTLEVYGNNNAYTSASELYSTSGNTNQGTKVGEISADGTLDIDGSYEYVGIRSKSGAVYVASIEIEWDNSTLTTTIPVSSVGWATFYTSNYNLIVPENIEARTYKVDGDVLAVSKTYAKGGIIPAGTGVVLKANQGNYTFVATTEVGENDEENMLKGSDVDETTTGGAMYYKLSLDKNNTPGTVGFYWGAADGAAFINPAHKAYLALPTTNNAPKAFRFDNETTGISNVNSENNTANGTVYNLSGQKVNNNYKGIIILNGKKMFVK